MRELYSPAQIDVLRRTHHLLRDPQQRDQA
jgi:hypothetical protein